MLEFAHPQWRRVMPRSILGAALGIAVAFALLAADIGAVQRTLPDRLPANFSGDSIADIYVRFLPPPKSEFETAADYQARLPKPTPGHAYSFVMDVRDARLTVDYDAEIEQFRVSVREDYGVHDGSMVRLRLDTRAIVVKQVVQADRSYVGQNAFGATRRVIERVEEWFAVAVDGQPPGAANLAHTVRVPVGRDRAAAMKSRLAVLLVCQAYSGSQPQTFTAAEVSDPTISNPYDLKRRYNYLRIDGFIGIVVFDRTTGEVLYRGTSF
jgi:hypothetical protein